MYEIEEQMPKEALIWGGIGLVPYIATSGTTVYLATRAGNAEKVLEFTGGGMSIMTVKHIPMELKRGDRGCTGKSRDGPRSTTPYGELAADIRSRHLVLPWSEVFTSRST
jgi:hypothetical protein